MVEGRKVVLAAVAALALVAAACSGNHSVSSGRHAAASAGTAAPSTTTSALPGAASPSAPATPGVPAAASVGGSAAGGAVAAADAAPAPGSQASTPEGLRYRVANLFTADRDRVGINGDQITLCTHAPLIFGPVFQDSTKDFLVYWQWLNDHGGVFGRKVRMVLTDDQYTPQGGVQAATQCAQSNPFFITAGVGFDTVPAVRQWAEQNKMLYLASFATERGIDKLTYSFEAAPSVEQFGRVAGSYVSARYPGRFAAVWRNSPNWQGGRDTFESTIKQRGGKVVADVPVQENQGDYTAAILQLKNSGAQTVLAWMNVLEFVQLEKQAAVQGYHPRWVTAAFNLVTDSLKTDVDGTHGPAAVGLWVTPEFHNGDTTSPWSGEEKAMAAAYATYDAGHAITDTDWQTWLAFRAIAGMLTDCGRDCSRNKLAGMFLSGYKGQAAPLCPVDFSRGNGRIGGFALNVMEGTNRAGKSGWKQVATCAERF